MRFISKDREQKLINKQKKIQRQHYQILQEDIDTVHKKARDMMAEGRKGNGRTVGEN